MHVLYRTVLNRAGRRYSSTSRTPTLPPLHLAALSRPTPLPQCLPWTQTFSWPLSRTWQTLASLRCSTSSTTTSSLSTPPWSTCCQSPPPTTRCRRLPLWMRHAGFCGRTRQPRTLWLGSCRMPPCPCRLLWTTACLFWTSSHWLVTVVGIDFFFSVCLCMQCSAKLWKAALDNSLSVLDIQPLAGDSGRYWLLFLCVFVHAV